MARGYALGGGNANDWAAKHGISTKVMMPEMSLWTGELPELRSMLEHSQKRELLASKSW